MLSAIFNCQDVLQTYNYLLGKWEWVREESGGGSLSRAGEICLLRYSANTGNFYKQLHNSLGMKQPFNTGVKELTCF